MNIYRVYLKDRGFRYDNSKVVLPNGFALLLPNEIYSHVIDEIFVMKVYDTPYINGEVIDVGGSIGDSALYFLELGANMIHVFEADTERFQLLSKNIKMNRLEDKIKALNIAVDSRMLANYIFDNNFADLFLKID